MDRRSAWHGVLKVLVGAIIGVILLFQNTIAASQSIDVTGLYVEANALKCDRSLMDAKSAFGEFRLEDCFRGYANAPAERLRLVQNGKKICGSLTGCLGWNCQRVLITVIVGTVVGGKLHLFVGDVDGQDAILEPEKLQIKFPLLSATSKMVDSTARTYLSGGYTRTSENLLNPAVKQECDPNLEGVVELKGGTLRVNGRDLSGFPATDFEFEKVEPRRVRAAPASSTVVLRNGSSSAEFVDERVDGNWVPRWVKVVNRTKSTVNLFAQGDISCAGYIGSQSDLFDAGKHPRPSTMRHTPSAWPHEVIPVSPGIQLWVQSCWGMRVVLSTSVKPERTQGTRRNSRRVGEAHE